MAILFKTTTSENPAFAMTDQALASRLQYDGYFNAVSDADETTYLGRHLHETRQKRVAGLHIIDPGQSRCLIRRSCNVRFIRSTRPSAWLEFAQGISMFSSQGARPYWIIA